MAPAEIDVTGKKSPEGWLFEVRVQEGDTWTRHTVSLARKDYERLAPGACVEPGSLVRRSFVFLLEREPKEAILKSFDLTVISRYFPEYEGEIRRQGT